jgi:laminin alpha 3/5
MTTVNFSPDLSVYCSNTSLSSDPSFRVGVVIDIKLDIRPRKSSGVLLSVHGRRDFLLLQMVNGVLKFSVDNGKGAISAEYTPPHEYYFCDGHWHTIQGTSWVSDN